jgi:hypothetical protein
MNKISIDANVGSQVKLILCSFFVFILIAGCSDDFLERKPKGQLTFDTFFETQDHAIWATNAVYQNFRSWQMCAFPWIGITDIISDDADKGSSPNDALYVLELDDFSFNATNTAFQQAWEGHYQTIFRANLAIINIPGIDMDATLRDRLVGENKFLRAYAYLRLVQWFGDLPLITRPLNSDEYYTQTRTPVTEIYNFIEQDLLDAIQVLPEKSDYPSADLGRATKGAARGMLANLYMVKHDFAKGAEYSEAVIQSESIVCCPGMQTIFYRLVSREQKVFLKSVQWLSMLLLPDLVPLLTI